MLLTAQPAPSGRMTVVLASEAGGTMIHEAIGHSLEGDLIRKGLSPFGDKIGQNVASPLISVVDDATLEGWRGSYGLDDEGSPGERTLLVERGVLLGFMHDMLSARLAGVRPTGNGRRQSYAYGPLPRMSNTMILPGESPPDDIIKSVSRGLYVVRMGGGQVNTVNGDFVFEINEGYIIREGEPAEPVRGATLIGNGQQVLKSIDMVGTDCGLGIGTCGKDEQSVPVADAQPTLRIPKITVGGSGE
jgi:TldD protein